MIGRRELLSALAAASLAGGVRAQPRSPIARTRHGPVRGTVEDGVAVFKGVRYGGDTGPRRFQPPPPPEAWSEPREALAYGAASP
ncbi:MAG TPA: carboxylesterase family protein, partial [Phenylobacterium sp.]|nr:carboxylesterase family protein [Phenylobacterium sp.]